MRTICSIGLSHAPKGHDSSHLHKSHEPSGSTFKPGSKERFCIELYSWPKALTQDVLAITQTLPWSARRSGLSLSFIITLFSNEANLNAFQVQTGVIDYFTFCSGIIPIVGNTAHIVRKSNEPVNPLRISPK